MHWRILYFLKIETDRNDPDYAQRLVYVFAVPSIKIEHLSRMVRGEIILCRFQGHNL